MTPEPPPGWGDEPPPEDENAPPPDLWDPSTPPRTPEGKNKRSKPKKPKPNNQPATPDPEEEEDEGVPYVFYYQPDFLDHFLATFPRAITGSHAWCLQWFLHPEAVAIIDALWHSWEYYYREPHGRSLWIRDHARPHLNALIDKDGPFKGCDPGDGARPPKHEPYQRRLPVDPPPDGLFERFDPENPPRSPNK